MSKSHIRPQRAALAGCCLVLASLCGTAWSQSAPAAPVSDADRAKRDAEKVFQWIRIHSDKPRKAAVAAPSAAPAAPAPVVATRSKPAAKPSDGGGITETVTPLVEAKAAAPRETGAAVAAAPEAASAATDKANETLLASAAQKAKVEAVDEDLALIPVHRTEPEFSKALMRTLRKGQVQVSFTVKPDGTVAEPHVVATTHPRLKDVAVATVSEWRFQPLRHAQQGIVDLGFNLD
jgi:outer membrane biosynthesis protein TonB